MDITSLLGGFIYMTKTGKRTGHLKRILLTAGIGMLLMLLLAVPALAASKKTKNKWKLKSNDYYYYYNSKGEKAKGLTKIGKKYYYFDERGHQLVGWRKIKGKYYRFGMTPGKKGYMLKNQMVDRLRLDRKGRADVSAPMSKRLAKVLVNYTLWADKITKPTWDGAKKLKAIAKEIYRFTYKGEDWDNFSDGWDIIMAEDCYARYVSRYFHYECDRYAVAFAYLCKAAGLRQVEIHVGGSLHAWVKVSGKAYDPNRYAARSYKGKLEISEEDFATNSFYQDNLTVRLYS